VAGAREPAVGRGSARGGDERAAPDRAAGHAGPCIRPARVSHGGAHARPPRSMAGGARFTASTRSTAPIGSRTKGPSSAGLRSPISFRCIGSMRSRSTAHLAHRSLFSFRPSAALSRSARRRRIQPDWHRLSSPGSVRWTRSRARLRTAAGLGALRARLRGFHDLRVRVDGRISAASMRTAMS
jgi:hypothetical protein